MLLGSMRLWSETGDKLLLKTAKGERCPWDSLWSSSYRQTQQAREIPAHTMVVLQEVILSLGKPTVSKQTVACPPLPLKGTVSLLRVPTPISEKLVQIRKQSASLSSLYFLPKHTFFMHRILGPLFIMVSNFETLKKRQMQIPKAMQEKFCWKKPLEENVKYLPL